MSMLGTLPVFEATSLDQLEGAVEGCLGAEIIRTATDAGAFSAQGHRRQVRKTALWHCSYQIPVSLKLPESNSIRLQIPIERSGGHTDREQVCSRCRGSRLCVLRLRGD